MIMLLHGAIANGRFLLWGETRPRDGIPAPRRTRPRRPPLLPFDAGPELLNAMAEMSFAPRTIQPITVLVPSVAGRPLPSSPLISKPPDVVADTTLTAWSVSALDLSTSQAV